PYFQSIRTTGDSRETFRDAQGAGIDWRPLPSLTLKFGYRRGTYDLLATAGNRLTVSTGSLPTSYGPDFTQGRAGAGSLAHSFAGTGKEGATNHYSFSGRFRPGNWQIDWAVSLGKSNNTYPVMPRGFFFNVTTRMVSPTVRFEGFNGSDFPRLLQVQNAQGA